MKRDGAGIGNGSSRLIWRLSLAMPRNIWFAKVSTLVWPCARGAYIDAIRDACSHTGSPPSLWHALYLHLFSRIHLQRDGHLVFCSYIPASQVNPRVIIRVSFGDGHHSLNCPFPVHHGRHIPARRCRRNYPIPEHPLPVT